MFLVVQTLQATPVNVVLIASVYGHVLTPVIKPRVKQDATEITGDRLSLIASEIEN